jgi:uncharacterized protein (DUF2062 family)
MKIFSRRSCLKLYATIVKGNDSPQYVARGWAIGMFYGCFIPIGLQLALSIPTSFLLKGSKIGATIGTMITNPVTIFFIYPIQCMVGNFLMGSPIQQETIKTAMNNFANNQTWETLLSLGSDLIIAFFIGGAILTGIMTPLTYIVVYSMVKRYRTYKEKQKTSSMAKK